MGSKNSLQLTNRKREWVITGLIDWDLTESVSEGFLTFSLISKI